MRTCEILIAELALSEHDYLPLMSRKWQAVLLLANSSDILIITEAGIVGGSLEIARHALDMGIIIMTVPGNKTSSYSGGTNRYYPYVKPPGNSRFLSY